MYVWNLSDHSCRQTLYDRTSSPRCMDVECNLEYRCFFIVIVIKHSSQLQRLGLFNIALIQLGFCWIDSFN